MVQKTESWNVTINDLIDAGRDLLRDHRPVEQKVGNYLIDMAMFNINEAGNEGIRAEDVLDFDDGLFAEINSVDPALACAIFNMWLVEQRNETENICA